MLCSLDRRRAVATIASGAIALGFGAGRAHAEGNHVLEAAAEIGRLLSASIPPAERTCLGTARWEQSLRDGAPIAALLAEVRAAAARDFASGTVVALDGSRLARAEAAFALACYESLSAAGRGCG
jgi:hypothetical protein